MWQVEEAKKVEEIKEKVEVFIETKKKEERRKSIVQLQEYAEHKKALCTLCAPALLRVLLLRLDTILLCPASGHHAVSSAQLCAPP